jgi:PAS domain S-box-containing protein
VNIKAIEINEAKINKTNRMTVETFENYPERLLEKWQEIADLLAAIIGVPAVLIMKAENEYIEVFISSKSENNPYKAGDKEKWYGPYCETVIKTQNKLLVPNATKDKNWDKNPGIKLGMIAYLGFPLNFPDNKPFGALCILDSKERLFTSLNEKLLRQFKNVIESDLALMQSLDSKTDQFSATVVQEITKRTQAEKALLLKNFVFNESLSANSIANNNGIITEVNVSFLLLWGYQDKDEVVGKPIAHFFNNPTDGISILSDIKKTGKWVGEFLAKRKDGSTFNASSLATDLKDNKGKIIGYQSSVIDVTDRKKSEEEKTVANQRLALAQKSAGAGVWDWDISTEKLFWSDELYNLFGIDPKKDPASFDTWRKVLHPEDRQTAEKKISESLKKQKPLFSEYRIILPFGKICWINTLGNTIYDEHGKALRMAGICIDITEKKKTEEVIKSLAKFPEESPYPVGRMDYDGKLLYCNHSCNKDLKDKNFSFKHVYTKLQNIIKTMATENSYKPENVEIMIDDKTFLFNIVPVKGENYINFYSKDITDLKQAEERLSAQNRILTSINKYTQAISFVPQEILFATIVGMLKKITHAAEIFINIYDKEKAELVLQKSTLSEENNTWIKKKFGDKLINVKTPVPRDKYNEMMNSTYRRISSINEATFGAIPKSVGREIEKILGTVWFVGLALKHKEELVGTIMIAGKKGSPELEKEEILTYANVTASVIAQKHSETELFCSENRFRATFEQAAVGIAHLDIEGHWLQVNQKLCSIVGYTREELMRLSFQDITYPEDLEASLELVQKMIDGKLKTYTLEKRYIRKDGSLVWINLTESIVRKPSGEPDYFISAIEDITERKKAVEAIEESYKKTEKVLDETIKALASIVEIRDPYTSGHQQRVTQIATLIAIEMGLEHDTINSIRTAALIHDIGKINVPASILSKPGKITDIEYEMIKTHPKIGYDIISQIDFNYPIAKIILQHHERFNGSGYPQGLKDNNIILEAKIISVADVIESMASHRPYRPALDIKIALKEIEENSGILYDAKVVQACRKLILNGAIDFHIDQENLE